MEAEANSRCTAKGGDVYESVKENGKNTINLPEFCTLSQLGKSFFQVLLDVTNKKLILYMVNQ